METPPIVPPPAFKNRLSGLKVFGVLEIILGSFFALGIPLSIFGQFMAARQQGTSVDSLALMSSFITSGTLATALIWLGLGSFQARRWARALLLCGGSVCLCSGVLGMIFIVPGMGAAMDAAMRQSGQASPPAVVAVVKAGAIGMMVMMYLVIPGSIVLFYRSPHVRLTCEQQDPVVRWTDRCPLPVLAWCLVMAYSGLTLLFMFKLSGAFPLFGMILTGWTARLLWLGVVAFMLYSAYALYRLQRQVWIVSLGVSLLGGLSSILTFSRHGLLEFYRQAGLPDASLARLSASPLLQGHRLLWMCSVSMILGIGYLLFLKRYFADAPDKSP